MATSKKIARKPSTTNTRRATPEQTAKRLQECAENIRTVIGELLRELSPTAHVSPLALLAHTAYDLEGIALYVGSEAAGQVQS
jgi:hypothetical protein